MDMYTFFSVVTKEDEKALQCKYRLCTSYETGVNRWTFRMLTQMLALVEMLKQSISCLNPLFLQIRALLSTNNTMLLDPSH